MSRISLKKLLRVEVAYALRERQVLIPLEIEEGATAMQAIERCGILREFPEIDLGRARIGVFGRVVPLDTPLKDGDRVEIYRSLMADPKEMRRERVRRRTGPSRS